MVPEVAGSRLSALFVDYDNIYLSLRRRSEEAAERFARDPYLWLAQIVTGRLIKYEWEPAPARRRIALGRCYGNPVPRRPGRDINADPHSFAYVRLHFMRAGFEVIDCPPLTAQLKNGSDIRMAIDIRDYIDHPTRFDEFIILSGDADFTPVLHRLRNHDRRTVIYANDYTAAPYAALCDGRVEEQALIKFLLEPSGRVLPKDDGPIALTYDDRVSEAPNFAPASNFAAVGQRAQAAQPADASPSGAPAARKRPANQNDSAIRALQEDFKLAGQEILTLVLQVSSSSERPVPIAYLADRAQKALGHPKTIGTNWAGSGGFLSFLMQHLPERLKLTDKPPHFVYDPRRHQIQDAEPEPQGQRHENENGQTPLPALATPPALQPAPNTGASRLAELQQSITRIYEACQAPPLPPSEYQLLFTLIAVELHENGYAPDRTAIGVVNRAQEAGLGLAQKDVAFVLKALDEIDPWLEHSRSASALARAYRDYVLSRCRVSGLQLTDDEHQLVQVWFGASQWPSGGGEPSAAQAPTHQASSPNVPATREQLAAVSQAEAQQRAAGSGISGLNLPQGSAASALNKSSAAVEYNAAAESEEDSQVVGAGRNPLRFSMFRRG
jgi:hypothetical protein